MLQESFDEPDHNTLLPYPSSSNSSIAKDVYF